MCFPHSVTTYVVSLWCVPSVMCVSELAMCAVCRISDWTTCTICCVTVSGQCVSSVYVCEWTRCAICFASGRCVPSCVSVSGSCVPSLVSVSGQCMPCVVCDSEWTTCAVCCVCQCQCEAFSVEKHLFTRRIINHYNNTGLCQQFLR